MSAQPRPGQPNSAPVPSYSTMNSSQTGGEAGTASTGTGTSAQPQPQEGMGTATAGRTTTSTAASGTTSAASAPSQSTQNQSLSRTQQQQSMLPPLVTSATSTSSLYDPLLLDIETQLSAAASNSPTLPSPLNRWETQRTMLHEDEAAGLLALGSLDHAVVESGNGTGTSLGSSSASTTAASKSTSSASSSSSSRPPDEDRRTDKEMEAANSPPYWADASQEAAKYMDEKDAILLSTLAGPGEMPFEIADPNDAASTRSRKSGKSGKGIAGSPTSPGTPLDPNDLSVPPPDPQKKKKMLYLEGLRGIAALVVAVHHYKQGTFRDVGYWWAEESLHRYIWHILWDGTFSVTLFYILSGRVLTAAFYTKKGPIAALASAVIRRPFRLGFPVAMAMVVNLILGAAGAYNATAQAARIMHSELWLGNANKWYLIQNAGDFFIFLVNMFVTVYKVLPVQTVYPCGVIWTIPVEWLGSLFVYLLSFMFVHIPLHRYYVYFVLWFVLWWTMNWNGVFLLGLFITDLAAAGHLSRWRKWKYIWTVQLLLVIIFFLMLTVDYVNKPIDTWTLSWQVQDGQLGGSAPWDQPKTTLIVAAFAEIMLVELSGGLQWFFATPPFVWLGKYSFGIYLVHGLVLYSVATRVWISLFNSGLSYWGIVVVGFIPYIIVVFAAAWCFYYLFDKPSIALGYSVYRWGFVEDWTKESFKRGVHDYAEGWRAWGGERKQEWESFWDKVCSCGKRNKNKELQ